MTHGADPSFAVQVAVVIPLYNEAAGLESLLGELEGVLADSKHYEVICVDDGSTDGTAEELARLAAARPWLRVCRHALNTGKSAALWTGVGAASAPVVATMNGDGRNDPAAIPRMLAELAEAGPGCGLVAAQRLGRHDSALHRLRSKIANTVRMALLDDGARDATCGLKCFPRRVFLDLPFFDGFHRYLPALVHSDGYAISLIDVVDRPRRIDVKAGSVSHGIVRGMLDLIGVAWLVRRRGPVPIASTTPAALPLTDVGAGRTGRLV